MISLVVFKVVEATLLPCRSKFQSGIHFKHRLLYRVDYLDDADAHAAH